MTRYLLLFICSLLHVISHLLPLATRISCLTLSVYLQEANLLDLDLHWHASRLLSYQQDPCSAAQLGGCQQMGRRHVHSHHSR